MLFSMLSLVAALASPLSVQAADPVGQTIITIEGMHCAGCAKSVANKLRAVKAVATVEVDAKTGKATVVASKAQTPSPKLLWEAVETAGYKPTTLSGPAGTFQTKPKS